MFYVQDKTELGLGIKHINFPKLSSLNGENTSVKPMINIYLKHRKLIAGSVYRPNSKKVYLVPSSILTILKCIPSFLLIVRNAETVSSEHELFILKQVF